MLSPIQKKRYEKRFATIESGFRVEGTDPIHDAVYREAKAQVLRGEMTLKQARFMWWKRPASCIGANREAGDRLGLGKTVELRSIPHPSQTARRMGHPDAWGERFRRLR